MSKNKWTPERDAQLLQMRSAGKSYNTIAKALKVSEPTVANRYNKLTAAETPESPLPPVINDMVNHPGHYTAGGVECIDAIKAAVPDFEAYCAGNVIKYVWRYRRKNGLEDLKKAKWYLDRLLKEVEIDG